MLCCVRVQAYNMILIRNIIEINSPNFDLSYCESNDRIDFDRIIKLDQMIYSFEEME